LCNSIQEKRQRDWGKLLMNLRSLESFLRMYILKHQIRKGDVTNDDSAKADKLINLKEGTIVSKNALTDTICLNECIQRYNAITKEFDKSLQINESIADMRNIIYHGRCISLDPSLVPMYLMNFAPIKNNNNQVKIDFNSRITDEWVKEQIHSVFIAAQTVSKADEKSDEIWKG